MKKLTLRNKKTRITATITSEPVPDCGEPVDEFHVVVKCGSVQLESESFYCKAYAHKFATNQVFAPVVH